jgi:hypothetical protein
MPATRNWLEPRVLVPSAIAVVAVVALITVLLVGGGSGGSTGTATPADASTTGVSIPGSTTPDGSPATTEAPAPTIPKGPYTTPTMPVQVEVPETAGVPQTDGVVDGQSVTVHASPDTGSQLFGVEARLCRGDVAVTGDGQFAPTLGGACIDKPLSAVSDAKVTVVGVEPYAGLDVTFRVGVGTTTFTTQYDGPATITCGPVSPCQIVLKLQYPKGFGFKGIPVTYR